MKRLSKRDNVSSILKRRATTVMMAATVIGAVGLSSTVVKADADLSLSGTEISQNGNKITVNNESGKSNFGITLEKNTISDGVTLKREDPKVNLKPGGSISKETIEKESKDEFPTEDRIVGRVDEAQPFKTMESNKEAVSRPEVKKEVPLYSDTVVTKRVDNDRIAKVERTLTIGEKVTQYPNGREIIRKREEKTVKTFIERIFESAPIISGYLSKNLPSEGGSRNIPNPHGRLEKPLEGTEGFREFPESTIHRGGGIQEEVGNTRRIAGSPGGTLHDKILQREGLGGFEQDIRSGGTLNSKIHGLFGFNEFPVKGKEGETKYPIVGGSNITKLPGTEGLSGKNNHQLLRTEGLSGKNNHKLSGTEGLSGKNNHKLPGTEGLSGKNNHKLPGTEGLSGKNKHKLPGTEGLSGKNNNKIAGIEGGISDNRETNNNSLKKNHSNGTWDLENIKPLIERDSDVYRPIYERKNHCRRICNPCRRTNPRIIYRPMNSGRRCLPRMSHTGPSFGINGFLGSIMLYLSAKVR